ncbi:MAG: leucyl aminopeptidase [Nitrospiraceae bacterium]|nr:MAG: leucyl aminopeptidase [Nitrospiraceae bacterium]
MKVFIRNIKDTAFACDALILPAPEGKGAGYYEDIDKSLNGLISKVTASGEFAGKRNETCLLHTSGKIKPERVLLIGLGKRQELSPEKLRQAGGRAASYLRDLKIKDLALSTHLISSLNLSPADFTEGCLLADYRFLKYKKEENHNGIKKITLLTGEDLQKQVRWAGAAASAVHFTRDLVNTPSNIMTPSALVRAARSLKRVSVKVIGRSEAGRLGMGAYLSVAKGSDEPPAFIVLAYKGKNIRPVTLIGKSITFDSGGISLKPGEGMEKMKYDMAGGAAVLGVMKAVSEMKLPVHLICVLPAAENLPGGSATKPGDVVKTISGKSIEIISTDAEGRLTVADAIEYAKRFKPSAIIDIATLTGACSIAFGNEAVAMMGNDEALMEKMKRASGETSERVWQMPLFEEYRDYIKSDIADLKNTSGRSGSLVSSAYFLSEFAGDTPWVHLDIAGTAWTDKDRPYIPKGATGIGVRLLLGFLKNL